MPLSQQLIEQQDKINKDRELNTTISQQDLTDIYRTLKPKAAAEYRFFSSASGTFAKTVSWVTK